VTLERHGVDARVDAAGCVRAERVGTQSAAGPHLVLNTHLDTVTPHVPFERDRDATDVAVGGDTPVDVIRGRGACDAKGPLAAIVAAFLAADPDCGRVSLAVTPDEETHSLGAASLTGRRSDVDDAPTEASNGRRRLDADLYIVGEPTGLDVCTAAKGRFEGQVHLSGVSAHAAESAGVNAIAAAAGALEAIRSFDADASTHPQPGAPKLTPTVINGGAATNQVPAECDITVDRRCVPPETAAEFRSDLEAAVDDAVDDAVDVSMTLTERESPFFEAFSTPVDHGLVTTTAEAAREATAAAGLPPDRGGSTRPFTAATEASYFAPAPTVVFGPGDIADDAGAVAHAAREYVRVTEVHVAAETLTTVIDRLLG